MPVTTPGTVNDQPFRVVWEIEVDAVSALAAAQAAYAAFTNPTQKAQYFNTIQYDTRGNIVHIQALRLQLPPTEIGTILLQ